MFSFFFYQQKYISSPLGLLNHFSFKKKIVNIYYNLLDFFLHL